jgi:chromosome segregation ATPase
MFLCGIVVTYVANADNYKQLYGDMRAEKDADAEQLKSLKKQLNEQIAQKQNLEDSLNARVTSLGNENSKLQGLLDSTEREKAVLLQKVNSWSSITKDFYQTNDQQGQLLKNTLSELNAAQADQIKSRKELNETTAVLVEKMAIIDTLEAGKRRLLEEKTELQSRLDRIYQPSGRVAAKATPVTPAKTSARLNTPVSSNISLQGLVKKIDLKNSMAEISIGSADGVKDGMKFHVTRGDEFVCDILIIDIDTEKAVGVLDLVQKQPRIGDNVSTNL